GHYLGGVPGAREPADRLAHLADRAALEIEGSRVDDRLVAVVEHVQAARSIQAEPALRRAEDRDAPVAAMRVLEEAVDKGGERPGVADRITGDDRDPTDDAVGDERASLVVQEVRLVLPKRERRQGVDAPLAHEALDTDAFGLLLTHPVPPGREPARDDPDGRPDAHQEHTEREPGA